MESNNSSQIIISEDLVNSKAIINMLLKGKHVYSGKEYAELKLNQDFYRKIFDLMDLSLVYHDMDFFYLSKDEKNLASQARSVCLFFFILLRRISVVEKDPSPDLTRPSGFDRKLMDIADLSSKDRALLEEQRVVDNSGIDKIIRTMKNLRFLHIDEDEERFIFNRPIYRLMELSRNILRESSEIDTGEEE